ncbi:hypothetical protein SDC9_137379 [bioreactor metagenome]|uniref:Uncharacterized protein n=1 Tax=bioreactor metagenome TaxID=1076179 RepID=A0A645DME7_9ZZZZ
MFRRDFVQRRVITHNLLVGCSFRHIHLCVKRIHPPRHLFPAEIERERAGDRDHQHGRKNADGGQSPRVLPHAVEHAGDGHKVIRLIVQALFHA